MSLGVPKIQDALGKKTGRLVDGQRSAGSRVVEGGGGSVQMSKPGMFAKVVFLKGHGSWKEFTSGPCWVTMVGGPVSRMSLVQHLPDPAGAPLMEMSRDFHRIP